GEQVEDEDLAVADATGLGALADGRDDGVSLRVVDGDLDLELGKEMHGIFGAAVDLGMALLPAVALDLGYRHAVDVERVEGLTYLFQPRRLDDRYHQFHGSNAPLRRV